jgi:hypothetical protein
MLGHCLESSSEEHEANGTRAGDRGDSHGGKSNLAQIKSTTRTNPHRSDDRTEEPNGEPIMAAEATNRIWEQRTEQRKSTSTCSAEQRALNQEEAPRSEENCGGET